LNASIIRAHPVITDTSLKVLYKLGTPLPVPSGQTATFSAHYTDPSGLSQVSGTNMQTPVATTDYLANTEADGSGTNETANIVVTATYYGDTVYYSILNNAGSGVWITFLQARGYGIYYGNSIESTVDDTTSQTDHGYFPFQFDMKYQKDAAIADTYGRAVIEEYKFPKSRITKMNYLANLNKNHLVSFLMLTIGSLILGTEDRSAISNHYYITDRAFTIKQGGIIHVEYGLKQNDSYLSGGLEPVAVEFAGGTSTDALVFGRLASVNNISLRTYAAWIYADVIPSSVSDYDVVYHIRANGGANYIFLNGDRLSFWCGFSVAGGAWRTDAFPFSTGAWNHIAVTFDDSSASNDPVIYINGVSVTVNETTAPSGTVRSTENGVLNIGNTQGAGSSVFDHALDGKIFDFRIYNRILTPAEVQILSNAGVSDHTLVTNGLVFQGFATYADRPLTAGTVLTSTDRLVENIIRAVGVPNGSPTIR
jgi:hypothetical protein